MYQLVFYGITTGCSMFAYNYSNTIYPKNNDKIFSDKLRKKL